MAILALGALVKAIAAIPLVLLIVALAARRPPGSRARRALALVGVAAALAAAFAAPFLQTENPTLSMADLATHQGWLAPTRFLNSTLGGLAEVLGGPSARTVVEAIVRVAVPLLFLLAFAVLCRIVARRETSGREGDSPFAVRLGAAWSWGLVLFTVASPVLLPWYVAWVLPVAWTLSGRPLGAAILLSGLLTISLTVAQLGLIPWLFHAILLVGHWMVSPVVLVVLVWMLLELRRRSAGGIPLEAAGAGGDGGHDGGGDVAGSRHHR